MAAGGLSRLLPGASDALLDILDPAAGAVQPPIRSELFGRERFAEHGRSLAQTHRARRAVLGARSFFPRVRGNLRMLARAHRYLGIQAGSGYDVSPAAEWILDNFNLIEVQLSEIQQGLPGTYFRTLPLLLDPPLAGLPRIYSVAWAFVAHTDGAFDEDLLAAFLDAYQDVRELTQSEMWALPTTMRVVLIENLRRLAERVAADRAAREVAHLCCDHIGQFDAQALDQVLALLGRRGVGRVFLAQMSQRLQDRRLASQTRVIAWLQQALPDAAAAQIQQLADQAADNLSVSNALTSLRAVGDADWPVVVARTSRLMRVMSASPVFEAEDAPTRGKTLHEIERLARRSGRSEVFVAQTLLARMDERAGHDDGSELASHWLRGPGRAALLRVLGLSEPVSTAWRAIARHLALPAYLGAIMLGTAALVGWLLKDHGFVPAGPASAPAWAWLGAALMLWPASETVVAVLNRLISESLRPQPLARLALSEGIPPEHRVIVVIPALLTDASAVAALARRLLLHHLANPERHAQFALLSDWADADAAHTPDDDTLLALAREAVCELNARHPPAFGDPPRFLLLHRPRRFSVGEQCWIGWERKRGKLEELVVALAEGHTTAFMDFGELSQPVAGTRHILTLDSDTQLPPGRLRTLVGVAAHPDNQPRLAPDGRSVARGYGILQPRLATPLPSPADITPFHWLFAGQCGIDPYSAASSEVYQDLFGEGTFTGKGLLDVRAMHAVLAGRLPEGRVLSHDLLEGAIARCAAVSDLTLIEEAPFHADAAASRVQRWMRGDWQLLPFLLRSRRWSLGAVHCWKMFDNLRRSLVPPMSLALLGLALFSDTVSPWAALGLVTAAFSAGPLMGSVAGLSPGRDDLALRHFYRLAGADVVRALLGGAWHLALLLRDSRLALSAIGRALYRMTVSHRHLLQWTTAATALARAPTSLRGTLRRRWPETAFAVVLLVTLLHAGTSTPALAVALCVLWAASPFWTWVASRPRPARREAALSSGDRFALEGIARDSWRFFERSVGPQDHHLPPDNVQIKPHEMVAHRTSPTNIGLYLLSVACARAFGWIGTAELLTRLEATLATLAKLERHHGHLLNWYDTQTCAPLLPRYVSTVDSGNLSGHLLALAQACLELARETAEEPVHAPRLRALAARCQQMAWQPEFSFLYHQKRRLLHIGWRVAEQELDAGFYDLLASESRLTSLLAIARGDVPVTHWAALGRPLYARGAKVGLRSWSGSMFEYLMPSLILDEPAGSVLNDACRLALIEQIGFTRTLGVPWGISESAYAASDHTLAYQYAPHGVPRLALRRTPIDELVIAPYATALAAVLAPAEACRNFEALEALGARGTLGFIEALDFSPGRRTDSEPCTPVATFMAHHQGMTLVALADVLLDRVAQRWGTAEPHLDALTPLLHERTPRQVSTLHQPSAGPPPKTLQRRTPGLMREVTPGTSALESTQVLSNGRYSVALRSNGAGWSRRGNVGITRWRDDALRDDHGSFFFLRWPEQPRDPAHGQERRAARSTDRPTLASITQHPAPDPAADYRCSFHADRVCFTAEWPKLQVHTTVWVSPEDDIEFRQVELRNTGDRALSVELISAFEATLCEDRADESHPAFMSLFVGVAWQPEQQALLFTRTPRLPTEAGLKVAHFLADADMTGLRLRIQTDRQRWRGRSRGADAPQASLDDTDDPALRPVTGLDPMCAMAVPLRLAPNSKVTLTFATAASEDAGQLHAIVDKYRQHSAVQRASLMSATLAGIRLRALRITPENFVATQLLSTALLLTLTRMPADEARECGAGVCDRRLLWRFGLSGDRPIILVRASVMHSLGVLRALAQALRLWAWAGVACDLVMIDAEPASYAQALHREMTALRERHVADDPAWPCPGKTGLLVLRAEDVTPEEMSTLQALARVQILADDRPLHRHVHAWAAFHERALAKREATSTTPVGDRASAGPVQASEGEFDAVSGEFRFEAGARCRPHRPWINVLASPEFGAHLSEAGGGHTWAVNSRLNQLTAWSNDPVADPPSEWFLLQDLRTLRVWSVAPSAWGLEGVTCKVAHGQGSTRISHRHGDLDVTATWCVDADTRVKQVRLQLFNIGSTTMRLRAAGIAEWILGASRADRATVRTAAHPSLAPGTARVVLLATQCELWAGFGDGTAFMTLAGRGEEGSDADDWTCDRREFFDARGRLVLPDHFGRHQGGGLDACAALSTRVTLPPGGSREIVFLIGWAESPDAARQLAAGAAAIPAEDRLTRVQNRWDSLLGATKVRTPDPLFDMMVNRWLLYQTVSCRLWAKAGFYQAGGATGFRDQLQDAMALSWAAPELLREQILRCASRQFPEGDVQHWWHAPGGAGVRTHFSDDLLWLAHACTHYLRATGDGALLDELVPFIEGSAVAPGAEDVYETPRESAQQAPVYEHAARTLDHSLRIGTHGLPLMGSGDWNDGMNRVGHEGRGESVWLAFFLCTLVDSWAPLARSRGDSERAGRWEAAAAGWRSALHGPGWDGAWFTRAFFDGGQPLGSHVNAEGRIDLIAQAWSVLSGAAAPERQREAMNAAERLLADADAGLIRLLDPPLVHARPNAGYIQAYPPGVRENGGQYSHAGVWALMAQAALAPAQGSDLPYRSFTWLSPAHRARHPTRGPAYGLEPYAVAGDICSQPPYVGRGGWSWYTGAAGWLHRAAIESIFGLRLSAQELSFTPCLPMHWSDAELTLRRSGHVMRFILTRASGPAGLAAVADAGARLLQPGERLRWQGLPADSCFVIPLPPAAGPAILPVDAS
jgi:cyclic beta-1,2-glucan synthetase